MNRKNVADTGGPAGKDGLCGSRQALSELFFDSRLAVYTCGPDGDITWFNTAAALIWGREPEAGKDRWCGSWKCYGPDGRPMPPEERPMAQVLHQGKAFEGSELRMERPDHTFKNILFFARPVFDEEGRLTGAHSTLVDITVQLEREQAVRQYTENLELLGSVSKAISEKLDVQEILQKVTDATTQVTGAAFGAFFYNKVDEDGESYMLYTLSGAPREAFEKFGMPRNTAVFHPTFSGQGIVRSDDITKDPRYGHNAPHKGQPQGHLPVVSYLAVPVINQAGTVIGGLFFGHPEPGRFREEHEGLVSAVVTQAAVALDNSRLFEEVSALNSRKNEFIGLAGHELNTPLTTLKGYLQILGRNITDEVAGRFVEKSLQQVEKLHNLISELLDVSRIESAKLQLNYESFDLRELLAEVSETFQYSQETHRILVDTEGEAFRLQADRQRIEQVLVNLIGNAVKYSPSADQVTVRLTADETQVSVSVSDQGIGMSAEQLKKIFTRFYRAEQQAGISGLGLGLYLTREIIKRHQGRITAQSEPGKGSVFTFWLPREKPQAR